LSYGYISVTLPTYLNNKQRRKGINKKMKMKTIAPRFIKTKNFSLTDKVEFRCGKIKNGFYLFPAVKLYYSENLVGFCII